MDYVPCAYVEVRARIDIHKCSFYRSRNVARAHSPEVTTIGFYHYMFVWGGIVWRWTVVRSSG